jgi:hypothetical protein
MLEKKICDVLEVLCILGIQGIMAHAELHSTTLTFYA